MVEFFSDTSLVTNIIGPLFQRGQRLLLEKALEETYGLGVSVNHDNRAITLGKEAETRLTEALENEGFRCRWIRPHMAAHFRERGLAVFNYDGYRFFKFSRVQPDELMLAIGPKKD